MCQFHVTSGFEILAFPCNQFGGQEPDTNEEIVQFACTRFKAEYPIFDNVNLYTVFLLCHLSLAMTGYATLIKYIQVGKCSVFSMWLV
jgi:hypothetical protein